MKKIIIEGGKKLKGTVKISGMKNAAVAVLPAALLAEDSSEVTNIPEISDVFVIKEIMEYLGAEVKFEDKKAFINPNGITSKPIKEEYSSMFRGSYYFMGVLLAKFKKVTIYFPGGCAFEPRPIDLHIKGFKELGVKIREENDVYIMDGSNMKGANINLTIASVGATINLMYAACMAKGITTIENAAKEPEVSNLATMLNSMGAKVKNAGTSTITIIGVDKLHGAYHEVIPDRIEAGTYLVIGALLADKLRITNVIPKHFKALILKLKEAGVHIEVLDDEVIVKRAKKIEPIKVRTNFYPGFPTDMQPIITPFLLKAEGLSEIKDNIYESRFKHIFHFNKMGADIKVISGGIIISGPKKLKGASVEADDLRAGAGLVVAGLIAEGTTTISKISHLLRGYEGICEKLTKIGAKIRIEEK